MPRQSNRSPADLPQQPEVWHVLIQQLRIWITPPDQDPSRPFLVLAINLNDGAVQVWEIVPTYPSSDVLRDMLFSAMSKPAKETGQKPHRPAQIQLEDVALTEALRPSLTQIGVNVQTQARLSGLDDMVADLEAHLRSGPENPGLLSVKGVTPALAGSVFAAAAEFYRAAPWVQLTNQHVLAVRVAPESKPRFVVVMGNGGVEYGLAVYRRWQDVEQLFGFAENPRETIAAEGGHSLFYGPISQLPFDDLEALEQHGWKVAGKEAYPIPVVFTRQGQVKRPGRADLAWYDAALRAIPIFVHGHLQPDPQGEGAGPFKYRPADVIITVPTHAGQTEVNLKFPAGTLPKETRPVNMFDWPAEAEDDEEAEYPAFDRRAMEGDLAAFSGGGFKDKKLRKAQELMYQAWDEHNPGRRLVLAHEALEISPDCTDAYVLLAEEEADTLGRALEYYQKGVAAGERALGKKYFKENEGYFWGLLETRPYMRARQGLAQTLWELDRPEEAIEHYRDMLRLNPGDNQGVRYNLLNLLLTSNHDAEALALIKQFEDDAMAEWGYTHALLVFRAQGASEEAAAILRQAQQFNAHVPDYLTGRKRVPNRMPPYVTWGGDDEAAHYANGYLPLWRRTPGAVEWLQHQLEAAPSSRWESRRARRSQRRRRG